MRGLSIAVVCLLSGCSPNEFGQGPDVEPMTTSSESSSSSGPPATTTGGSSSTTVASTSGSTADGTSTGPVTDGSSSTTAPVLACGESLPDPGGCDDETCVQCEDSGQCLIECGGGGSPACTSQIITCPEDRPCRVECSGTDSCRDAVVECPPHHECIVRCSGAACGSLSVKCGAGPCSLACITSAMACDSAVFDCGSNDSTVTCNIPHANPPSAVSSGSECECTSMGCDA